MKNIKGKVCAEFYCRSAHPIKKKDLKISVGRTTDGNPRTNLKSIFLHQYSIFFHEIKILGAHEYNKDSIKFSMKSASPDH